MDANPSSESPAGVKGDETSDSLAPGVLAPVDSTFRDGASPMLMGGSLKPLLTAVSSLYNIYSNWRGMPQITVKVAVT